MADQKITELPIKKSSAMAATDYLLGIDSNEGYQMLIQDLGDYILRNTTLSDLATTSKNALGAINEAAQATSTNTAGRIGMLSNVNLDDLHTDNTCGVYWLNNYSSDITGTKPVAEGQGLLIVKKQNSTTYRQTYIAVTGNTSPYFAVRSYSTSWGEWQSASLQTILNTTYALGYSGMGRIQQNDDLNSYTTPGSYVATSTGITSTLSNCPIANSGFSLHVESVAGGTGQFIVQTIKRVSDGADIYTRTYSGSVWTGWKSSSAAPKQISSVANLSDLPLGSNGYAQFDASVSPTRATAYFTYWCTGTTDRRSIIAVYTADSVAKVFVNVLHTGTSVNTWKGWKYVDTETEYTSLACSYGTLAYKCYKTGRIVSLIATIDVTSDIPKSSDFITGLPYTGQTSNYTPIRAFDDTTKTYIDLDLHRVSTSSCAVLSRTAIASGASIRINATYATE